MSTTRSEQEDNGMKHLIDMYRGESAAIQPSIAIDARILAAAKAHAEQHLQNSTKTIKATWWKCLLAPRGVAFVCALVITLAVSLILKEQGGQTQAPLIVAPAGITNNSPRPTAPLDTNSITVPPEAPESERAEDVCKIRTTVFSSQVALWNEMQRLQREGCKASAVRLSERIKPSR